MAEKLNMKDLGSNHVEFARKVATALSLPYPEKPEREKGVSEEVWLNKFKLPVAAFSRLTGEQLAEFLARYSQLAAYVVVKVSEAETRTEEYKWAMDDYLTEHLPEVKGNTLTEKKALIKGRKTYIDFELKWAYSKAVEKNIRALLTGYEKKYTAISREISRRETEDVRQGRAGRRN